MRHGGLMAEASDSWLAVHAFHSQFLCCCVQIVGTCLHTRTVQCNMIVAKVQWCSTVSKVKWVWQKLMVAYHWVCGVSLV